MDSLYSLVSFFFVFFVLFLSRRYRLTGKACWVSVLMPLSFILFVFLFSLGSSRFDAEELESFCLRGSYVFFALPPCRRFHRSNFGVKLPGLFSLAGCSAYQHTPRQSHLVCRACPDSSFFSVVSSLRLQVKTCQILGRDVWFPLVREIRQVLSNSSRRRHGCGFLVSQSGACSVCIGWSYQWKWFGVAMTATERMGDVVRLSPAFPSFEYL